MKDPNLRNENWERFLPKFEKKNLSKRKQPFKKKEKKAYTPFPPPMPESKIDKELASGEFFLKDNEKKFKKHQERREQQAESVIKREAKRNKAFKPPKEDSGKKDEAGPENKKAKSSLDLDALKAKVKAASGGKKKQPQPKDSNKVGKKRD